ncbi:phytoene/squalene synthase family protein [Sphingomonas sp. CFBP 13720]|uniref:phytoene/squalene synthase family protein n=1 Tax=Sphingomonas sp. CFBP 13720 TaxID=2775302 RepID=UPI00406C9F33
MADRPALVAAARDTIARGSKSFAAASTLFDPATRERAWLLYAWCRACDDLADGQELGHGMQRVDDAPARLALIRERTALALAGRATGDASFDALGVVAAETNLPHALVYDVIDGFQLDADDWRPRTEADLYQYCYHVAGAVGGMMAVVMGVDPADTDTLDRACDLGLAFQLANIARDVGEDAAAGRCYLPTDWLAETGIAQDAIMAPANRAALTMLARRMTARARLHEDSARIGAARLPWRSRWAVLAAADIYGGIARKVAAAGDGAWDRRQTTSKAEKLVAIGRSFLQARLTRGPAVVPRDPVLWTRPRD